MMKIAFIGATGMLGKPVARELQRRGFETTILARNSEKAKKILPQQGLNFIDADVFDTGSLVSAFKGHEIVYLNLSVLPGSGNKDPQPEREGIANVIVAAGKTGIQRIIYLSSLIKNYQGMDGFDWWAFRIKHEAVNQVKTSGLAYTIFYPSTFMETLDHQLKRGNFLILVTGSKQPNWFIAAADYSKQVAGSIEIGGKENKEYDIQGPVGLNWYEATKIFLQNSGNKKLRLIKMPIGLMKFFGNFSAEMNYGYHICKALNLYPEKFTSEDSWRELGRPEIRLEEYAGG